MAALTDRLIDFSAGAVPQSAREMMRLSLFDWAACGIAGAQLSEYDGFLARLHATGGASEAFVLGGGALPAATAALINGTLSHALDYDDTHFAHIGHPSVAVIPAVLAVAERTGADLAAVIDAATIGVEASIHVGIWLGRGHYQVGFHQTATAGAFGATLGVARVLGLSSAQTRTALGLCASMASGIKAQFGTMAKPLNAGLAARTGVEATEWAQVGLTAAADGLAGPLGFGPTHHGAADEGALAAMGQVPWQIESISHKYHACCHGLHAMLEALRDVTVDPAQINAIQIRTHPRWMTVCNIPDPQTGLAAKFSYGQTSAMTLLGHDTGAISSFTDAITQDRAVTDLRDKVSVREDDRLTETQTEVSLILTTGQHLRLRHDLMAPMEIAERAHKLQVKASALIGTPKAELLWHASQGDETAALLTILSD